MINYFHFLNYKLNEMDHYKRLICGEIKLRFKNLAKLVLNACNYQQVLEIKSFELFQIYYSSNEYNLSSLFTYLREFHDFLFYEEIFINITFKTRLSNIRSENFSTRLIRYERDYENVINNRFDDLIRLFLIFYREPCIQIHYLKYFFPKFINKPWKINTMPTDMVIYEISNFKKKNQKLTKNVIHIITNKVISAPVCSICLDNMIQIENKSYSSFCYNKCGHTVCQLCNESLPTDECSICRDSSYLILFTVNNGYCAGSCNTCLSTASSLYLSSCGHVYCYNCIHYGNNRICFKCNKEEIHYYKRIYLNFE